MLSTMCVACLSRTFRGAMPVSTPEGKQAEKEKKLSYRIFGRNRQSALNLIQVMFNAMF